MKKNMLNPNILCMHFLLNNPCGFFWTVLPVVRIPLMNYKPREG